MRDEKRQEYQHQVKAATRIQACHRMIQARQIKLELREDWQISEIHRHQAALRLQCAWRMSEGVKEWQRLKEIWQVGMSCSILLI